MITRAVKLSHCCLSRTASSKPIAIGSKLELFGAAGGHEFVASSPALLHGLTASGQAVEKGVVGGLRSLVFPFLRALTRRTHTVIAPFSNDFALSKINGEGPGMRR